MLLRLIIFEDIFEVEEYKKMLIHLLQAGASCFYKNKNIHALAYIASYFDIFCDSSMICEDEVDEEYEKFENEVIDLFDFLISSFLSHGFDPNEPSPESHSNCIEWFVEYIVYVCSGEKATKKYKSILENLLRHGSNFPRGKNVENNLKEYIIELFDEWPRLMLLYCLERRNQFIYL